MRFLPHFPLSQHSLSARFLPGILSAGLFLATLLTAPSPSFATPLHVKISKQEAPSGTHRRRIRLLLAITPAPRPGQPVHLHVYLDGRMLMMRSFTSSPGTITLPRLAPGHHEVSVVAADALTHQEKGAGSSMQGMKMDGMDMGGMEMKGMDMGEDAEHSMKSMERSSAGALKSGASLGSIVINVK